MVQLFVRAVHFPLDYFIYLFLSNVIITINSFSLAGKWGLSRHMYNMKKLNAPHDCESLSKEEEMTSL